MAGLNTRADIPAWDSITDGTTLYSGGYVTQDPNELEVQGVISYYTANRQRLEKAASPYAGGNNGGQKGEHYYIKSYA